MPALGLRQRYEKLAGRNILRLLRGILVEICGHDLHGRCLGAQGFGRNVLLPPEIPTLQKAPHILAPDRRQALAEARFVEGIKAVAMPRSSAAMASNSAALDG